MAVTVASGIPAPARRRGYALTAGVLLVMMLGGTLPVPLYVLYEKQMGFGPLGVTVVFAAYVVGTLFALVALGDLSDHIGRRKVLAIAVVCAAVSTALFLAASGIGLLIAARVVSGTAAGFATGTATAALAELQPRGDHRAAAVVASGSNMTGLGLGPLTAGLFAEYVAMPTRSVFWAYLGACALALAALMLIPETVSESRWRRSASGRASASRPGCGSPCSARVSAYSPRSVSWACSAAWCPPSCTGSWACTTWPLIGGASFLIFVIAAISQAVSARLPSRNSVSTGLPLLLICLAALETALFTKALWLFLAGTVRAAWRSGSSSAAGLSELNRLAEPRHRAAVVSTFFVAAYLGLGVPAVLTGLISLAVGPVDASAYVSGLAAAAVVVAFVVVLRTFGAAPAPEPPSTPSDGWCRSERYPAAVR